MMRRVVGVALLRDGDDGPELLAARRTEPPELAGGWELPGGKVEPGESEQEAARREIVEELGVSITLGDLVPGPPGGWPLGEEYRMVVYTGSLPADAQPRPLVQHDAIRWVPLREWASVDWLPGDIAPVRAVVALVSR